MDRTGETLERIAAAQEGPDWWSCLLEVCGAYTEWERLDDAGLVGLRPDTPGVYLLCQEVEELPRFYYVGRSADLRKRLGLWVPEYDYFCYRTFGTEPQAYQEECAVFHALRRGLDNTDHPTGPAAWAARCPVCGA